MERLSILIDNMRPLSKSGTQLRLDPEEIIEYRRIYSKNTLK